MCRQHIGAPSRTQVTVWAAFTLALTGVFLAMTAPDLGRYPPVSGDDSWVMSASYKLATTGVFGSDLYAGFHGADEHYFIALPGYQVLQALSFTLFGAGIAQARLVTLLSAVVVLWATTWLALRWHGPLASGISGLLLVGLRVNLVDLWPGLPLLAVGRTGRYDMTGVAFVWLTIVFLDLAMQHPRARRAWPAYAAGVWAGLATLSQFFGAFTILIVGATLLWRVTQRLPAADIARRFAASMAAIVTPYLLYVAWHWSDFKGQSALKSGRIAFQHPSFYLNNLRDEPARYQHLVDPDRMLGSGTGGWLFVIAIWPVLGWLAWRGRRPDQLGDRLLLTTLIVCGVALALSDSTNVPLYTIVLWPGCCLAVAAAIASGLLCARRQFEANRHVMRRPLLAVATIVALVGALAIVADGIDAYRDDRQRAQTVADYADVAERLDATLPAEAAVIGHERWWWGFHERQYLALNALQLEWVRQADATGRPPSFAALFDASGADALLIDDNARSEITRYPAALRQQIDIFLATRVDQAAVVVDPTYGRFEVYVSP